jgi:predicted nucleotidyltransferase
MSQAEVITIVKSYLNALKQAGIPVEMAFLYGSYARNEATLESDIDLLLVSSVFDTSDDYVLSSPWLYTTRIDPRIEPYAVGLKKFRTDHISPLLEIVRKEGIRIYAA